VTGGIYEVDWGGGNDSLNSLTSTEIYDPQTNRWSALASTLIPRAQDTATLMKDGRVVVVGGYDCGFARGCLGYGGSGDCCGASSAEIYDPASNTWEYTGPVLTGNEHTATLLPEGGVLVTGGNVSPISMYELSSAEIYAARYPPDEPPSSPVVTAVSAPPSISHLAESHKRWREGHAMARISARESKARRARAPLGTTFTFTLNEQATITFTFVQQLPGRLAKGMCAAPSRSNRHRRACERTATRGSLTFTGHSGPNTVSFQGRLSRSQKLAPGRYALLITATNAAGLRSTTRPLTFTILDPRPSGGR
jgi:Kelch motif